MRQKIYSKKGFYLKMLYDIRRELPYDEYLQFKNSGVLKDMVDIYYEVYLCICGSSVDKFILEKSTATFEFFNNNQKGDGK